jgi:hypothetical protein
VSIPRANPGDWRNKSIRKGLPTVESGPNCNQTHCRGDSSRACFIIVCVRIISSWFTPFVLVELLGIVMPVLG